MSGLPWVSLRLANITGPRLAIGPIPTFYKRLKAGQGCFCTDARARLSRHVRFSCRRGPGACATMPPTGIFNVSSGEGHTIKEVFDAVRRHLGLPADPACRSCRSAPTMCRPSCSTPRGPRSRWVGARRSASPKRSSACCRWYDAHGVSDVYSHLQAPAAAC